MATDPSFANKRYIPPWKEPYIIGIAGCSGSGKTSIAQSVIQQLNFPWTVLLSMDNFYKPLTAEQKKRAFQSEYDFDRPEAFDWDALIEVLQNLKTGRRAEIPTYSFKEHDRTSKWLTIYGANVIILEGIYALYDKRVYDMMDSKVFVETDFDVCLARRLSRDITYRGRELVLSIKQWERFVKPNFDANVYPCRRNADVMIPRGLDNVVGINLLVSQLQRQLLNQSNQHLSDFQSLDASSVPEKTVLIPQTPQIQALHTILSDCYSSRENFQFYFDRIGAILISRALDNMPHSMIPVETQTSIIPSAVSVDFSKSIAVTMIRGGECFEKSLRDTVPDIRIGKILILSDTRTGEPQLHNLSLPKSLGQDRHDTVMLLDTEMLSGAAATMATAVLIDHGVPEKSIVFVCYRATEIAIARLKCAFPAINVVVGMIAESKGRHRYVDTFYYGT